MRIVGHKVTADHNEIDEINILQATFLAMKRAIAQLEGKADFALIDGNCSRGFNIPTETVVGGDKKSYSIHYIVCMSSIEASNRNRTDNWTLRVTCFTVELWKQNQINLIKNLKYCQVEINFKIFLIKYLQFIFYVIYYNKR